MQLTHHVLYLDYHTKQDGLPSAYVFHTLAYLHDALLCPCALTYPGLVLLFCLAVLVRHRALSQGFGGYGNCGDLLLLLILPLVLDLNSTGHAQQT